jgi:dipicolinate synthase subunit B
MRLSGKTIGVGVTGSHCTVPAILPEIARIREEGAKLYAIVSDAVEHTDTRFMSSDLVMEKLLGYADKGLIRTITAAEPIGPKGLLDMLVLAPCTGNTLAKLAHGITDTAVLMAAKAQLRKDKPVVIAISTNDGLSANLGNIGILLNRKHVYFVPFGQDDPKAKPYSLVAHVDLLLDTMLNAFDGRQLQPILV